MKLKLLVFILFFTFLGKAQTYSVSPAKTVTFTAALNNITVGYIYQVNTGNTKIKLKWEKVSINLPPLWNYSMCDYATCYSGIPNGPNAMDSVAVGGQGFLGLNIDPGNNAGAGTVKVFVYQDGFRSSGDTLTWYVTAGVVGVEEITANASVKAYPNPVTNKLFVNLGYTQPLKANITDALGREVMSLSLTSTINTIDVSALPIGFYVLNIETADKNLFKRIIKE